MAKYAWQISPTSINLIGEHVVDTKQAAFELAEQAARQAMAIFGDTAGWTRVPLRSGNLVETKPVGGFFRAAGTNVARGFKDIPMNADVLFRFVISPEGYALIDPDRYFTGLGLGQTPA